MPKLDSSGPEGLGARSGRKLGKCSKISEPEKEQRLGVGMGERRQSGGGIGMAKRLKSGLK